MASIFDFDPNPPKFSSPWLSTQDSLESLTPWLQSKTSDSDPSSPPVGLLADYGLTKLEAEPQEGPIEYKLHLLLRPRRIYSSYSTGLSLAASRGQLSNRQTRDNPELASVPSSNSRQNRLQQLTTQLLWRLQQSSTHPRHASAFSDQVLPKIPVATEYVEPPARPRKPTAGLEESNRALYQIGVSDNGTLVGLTKDEMDESLMNLRAMAASLGCSVEVIRTVVVGQCEWHEILLFETQRSFKEVTWNSEAETPSSSNQMLRHREDLYVTEALVSPDFASSSRDDDRSRKLHQSRISLSQDPVSMIDLREQRPIEQLRCTLIGPTTCGKSTLLGTLSTATLDNGRGKSRLSLLKHRHEIESGVTSSLCQELIGYKGSEVINYASVNVASWTDTHASARSGRLVFLTDCPGQFKYRRSILRGLLGWEPHWILLCVAADSMEGNGIDAVDLAKAQMELALKLDKPLAIVITKLDMASKAGLRGTLSLVLSALKMFGRIPSIVSPENSQSSETDLSSISRDDDDAAQKVIEAIKGPNDMTRIVPIVMSSATRGIGIRSIHALLRLLPMPSTQTYAELAMPSFKTEQPYCLFHIEDIFNLAASYQIICGESDKGAIVSGHLRSGKLQVGDHVLIGPFQVEQNVSKFTSRRTKIQTVPNILLRSKKTTAHLCLAPHATAPSAPKGGWYNARVVSLRNLRLPVKILEADQIGTVGIIISMAAKEVLDGSFEADSLAVSKIRKGMVLAIPNQQMIENGHTLKTASGFTASFEDCSVNSISSGSSVTVYIASIRAPARIVRLRHRSKTRILACGLKRRDDSFGLQSEPGNGEQQAPISGCHGVTDITFEFATNREWLEIATQIVMIPIGGHIFCPKSDNTERGVTGLRVFVGLITEILYT